MSKKQARYWTRKLELELVEFVKQREFIWRPVGNTNHDIQKKYKAYAEFAAFLDRGFTARSVRDRWVNIRSTFNHYLRRVEKSKSKDQTSSKVYVPCWPLWKPLQFLRERENTYHGNGTHYNDFISSERDDFQDSQNLNTIKHEQQSEAEEIEIIDAQRRALRTDRPRTKAKIKLITKHKKRNYKCAQVLDDLLTALKPLSQVVVQQEHYKTYWFFGNHVTERLNAMSPHIADSASFDIMRLLGETSDENNIYV